MKKKYKTISLSEFTKIKNEHNLKLLSAYSSVTTNVYEFGNDLIFENFIGKRYWVNFDKISYIKEFYNNSYRSTAVYKARFNEYLVSIDTFINSKDKLLNSLWRELKLDQTNLHYETITKDQLVLVNKQIKKYGFENVEDKLLLSLAVFIGECAKKFHKSGNWTIERKNGEAVNILYFVNGNNQKIDVCNDILKSMGKYNNFDIDVELLLIKEPTL